ncbi:arylsulfotransferase family protein [uncultured Jatrophihabitans sp.]|uniref:arylsulfotransferase family protein n=1 Tax=uncultured Jatrophihabitans sp. TaxID=1610747 RepID=UPI0035CB9D12
MLAGASALAAVTAISATVGTASAAPAATALPAPRLTIAKDDAGSRARGDIFVAPYGTSSSYGQGAEILSPDGKKVVWFHRAAAGTQIADFRPQTYRGKPVLTFWQGTGLGGLTTGADYIYDSHHRRISTVRAGKGLHADGHEFLITKKNTALVLAYTKATADLTSIGGPANQAVINGVVQEIDIKTGKVLFSWNSADHVPYSASQQPLPASASTPWDWFHVNAVKVDSHNNLLVDSRNTWAAYDIQRRTGKVLWTLGGKNSSFTVKAAKGTTLTNAGTLFAWQHDIEDHGRGVFTVFDNSAAGLANTGNSVLVALPYSRSEVVKLDVRHRTATLVAEDDEPATQSATSQGSTQLLPNGNIFTGWGALPRLSEFTRAGRLVFDASYPTGLISYRAYRAPWRDRA